MLTNREVGTVSALALLSLTAGAFTTPPELGCLIGFAAIAVGWTGIAVFGWLRDRTSRVPPAIVVSARSTRASEPVSPPSPEA
jgi:hypothetical protein